MPGWFILLARYYLILVQHTKHPIPHSLNHLFSLIKLLAQLLRLVVVSDDGQALVRNPHRHARARLRNPAPRKD